MSYQYMESLPGPALGRYREKLRLVGSDLLCPYQYPADSWINDPGDWPKIEYPDIYHYLIRTPGVFTDQAMKNYRSLEAHKFFLSGWVQTIFHQKIGGNYIFRCDVKPSWRVTEEPHHPWVAVNQEGVVTAAHCDCMAGLGESCSHIGAVLFKLEAAVRMGYTTLACTDDLCKWNACFVDNIEAAPISEIKFYTETAKNKRKNMKRTKQEPTTATKADQQRLLTALAATDSNIVGLSAFEDFADRFIPSQPVPPQVKLPTTLRKLFDVKNRDLSHSDLSEKCQAFQINITDEQIRYVEETSRAQSASLVWHEQRVGRITASIAHDALHTHSSNPAPSFVKKVSSSNLAPLNVPAVQWGKDHEDDAFRVYTALVKGTHDSCETSKSGFIICKSHPFLGASTDGFVGCKCCGKGCIEIKCPYKFRDTSITEAAKDKDFCLDGCMTLKKTHRYHAQVQMQMFVCDHEYADFVLWTCKSFHKHRIQRDEAFISSMVAKLEIVWRTAVLPELLTRRVEEMGQPSTAQPVPPVNETLYCICRSKDGSGNMVACDHCNEWFHIKCLKLKRLPARKTWYCANCKKQKKKEE